MKSFNSIKIRLKLPVAMVLLTFVAVGAMGTTAYQNARHSLQEEAEARLVALGSLQSRAVKAFFETILLDLEIIAHAPITSSAIRDFTRAFAQINDPVKSLQKTYIDDNPHPLGSKDQLVSAGTGTAYDAAHERYHPFFDRLQDAHDYYDVFLFDTEGNLIYSVFKELDYATNMYTGQWKDTDLAVSYRRAMELEENAPAAFEDFEPYEPSYGAPASFIARPVFTENGERLGVLIYQMPVDAINATVRGVEGLGETGDVFMVGSDRLLRTDSAKTEVNDILETSVNITKLDSVLAGDSVVYEFDDLLGKSSVGYIHPLSFLGVTWALAVTENTAELYAPIAKMQRTFFYYAATLLTVTLVLSILLSRNITNPLSRVGDAMGGIARKKFDTQVIDTGRGDEIGSIAKTLEDFRKSLQAAEGTAREAAYKGAGFDVSGAAMLVCDPDLNVTYVNRSMKQLVKNKRDDFLSAVPEIDSEKLTDLNMRVFEDVIGIKMAEVVVPEKLPLRKKLRVGDSFIGLLFDAVHNLEGELVGYVGEWRDQTFQMSSEVIRKAIDSSQGRLELKLDKSVKFANDILSSTLGVDEKDLIGLAGDTLLTHLDSAKNTEFWQNAINGDTSFGTFRIAHNGTERLLEGSFSPLPDENGRTGGYLLIATDVTEQRAAVTAAEARQREMVEAQNLVVEHLRLGLERLSKRDLSTQIDVEFSEENERLRADFNRAVMALSETIANIATRTETINGESASISSAVEDLSNRTEAQASALEKTATALDGITASIKSAAESAGSAASLAEDTRENAISSGKVVKETVSAMDEIEESSAEMLDIISVIDDIAFQTNLLALNAGVEAARAGEAGRGFAVVASEVRALAQRSSEAAKKINELITSSGQQVSRGANLVTQTGKVLQEIITSVAEISDKVRAIADSADKQSNGLLEINSSISQLDGSTQQNAAMVEETTAASHLLKKEASAMSEEATKFTLRSEKTSRDTERDMDDNWARMQTKAS